jgi:cobalamin biosynthesis protein CobT
MTQDVFAQKGSTATPDNRDERAQRAVKTFRSMQPGLSGLVRAFTGNPHAEVVLDNGTPRTDGTKVYYKPPIALGDLTPHNRRLCDRRDKVTKLQLCPACKVREEVIISIIHEIAHIAFQTFEVTSERAKNEALQRAIEFGGTEWAKQVKAAWSRIPDFKKNDYLNLSGLISPYLPLIVNGLEDTRVDENMFRVRKGTRVMFDAYVQSIFASGIEQDDGTVVEWRDKPLNSQVIIGTFVLASGYRYEGWFSPEVEAALGDKQLRELCGRVGTLRSAAGTYELSFPILTRLRELGFCRLPDEPDEPEQEPETEPEEQPEEPEEAPDNPPLDEEGEEEESDDDSDMTAPGDGDAESDDPTEGEGAGNNPGEPTEENDDDSEGNGKGSGTPGGGESDQDGDRSDEPVDPDSDQEGGAPGPGGSGTPPEGSGDPEEASEEAGSGSPDGTDDGDVDSDVDGGDSGDDQGSESGSGDGEDAAGTAGAGSSPTPASDDGGKQAGSGGPAEERDDEVDQDLDAVPDQDAEPADGGGDSGESTGGADGEGEVRPDGNAAEPGKDFEREASKEGKSEASDDGRPECDPSAGVNDDDDEAVDSGADEGKGGTKLHQQPNYGDADKAIQDIKAFGQHEVMPVMPDDPAEREADDKAIDLAIIQGQYFETPSAHIAGVREHFYGKDSIGYDAQKHGPVAWDEDYPERLRRKLGIDADLEVEESVLGPVLVAMRKAFAENKRAKMQKHLRSGRVNGRVLGKRAWAGDDRLFQKKRLPGKRSYAVIIGIDISGSTVGRNLALAKRAAMAQAEMCDRTGIDFAIYAHTANGEIGRNRNEWVYEDLTLDMYEIKSFDQGWDDKAREALGAISSNAENLDGHGIEYYRRKIERHPATDKIILYYTDGKMPAANHDEELEILIREINYCKAHKITLLGVGIRTDSPRRHGLDTVEVHNDTDLVKVVRHLETALLHNR